MFKIITGPAVQAVSLADVKEQLRLDGDDLDQIAMTWLAGIVAYAENATNRAFITQSWRGVLKGFPCSITLPRAPVASITDIKYYDASNVLQTLASTQYTLDNFSEPCRILPAPDVDWPDTYDRFDAVTINFACGYGTDEAAIPKPLRLYLLAKLVEQFDPAIKPEKDTVQASFIDSLLDQYRVYG